MSLADDLLELAKKSVNYSRSDVLDARLRRSVSTAYYALFHLLVEDGAARLTGHSGLRMLVGRAFVHGEMYKTARAFRSGPGGLPTTVSALGITLPPELSTVASAFIDLQDAQHEADYNLGKSFVRAEARDLVDQVGRAFTDWRTLTTNPAHADVCDLFLAALLLGQRWNK